MTDPARSPAPPRPTRPELWALAAIVAVAILTRFVSLDAASYWLDESYSVLAVRGSLGDTWHAVVSTESTPPLYYLLGWGWAEVFGTSAFGLRSLSAVAGVALVPVVWLAGRELASRRGALVAAALTAVNPLLVWYAQEARSYALLVLLCTLAFWQLARARRGAPGAVGWWALAAALALTAHYVAVFPLAVEAALLLWWRRDRPAALAAGAVALVGALLVPLIVTQRGNALANESEVGAPRAVTEWFKQLAVGYDLPAELVLSAISLALLLAGVVLAARAGARTRRGVGLAALVAAASPVGLLLLAAVGQNQLMTRYLLPASPLLLLIVGAGFGARRAGRWGLAGAAALTCAGLAVTVAVAVSPADRSREDWKDAAAFLRSSSLRPRALVLFPASGEKPLGLYLPGLVVPPGPNVTVRELDFVDVARNVDHRRPVAFPPALPGNPQLRLAAVHRSETAAVARYVSPVPAEIPVVSFVSIQAGGRPSAVLVQP